MIRIYVNLDGLAGKMRGMNRPIEANLLRQFAAGLNQSQHLVDLVDVGHCKEGADVKIKAVFDHYAPDINVRCKHIVLGCSNDHGYLRMLAPYKHKSRYFPQIHCSSENAVLEIESYSRDLSICVS